MFKSQQRAEDAATKVYLRIKKMPGIGFLFDNLDQEVRTELLKSFTNIIEKEILEYAGERPIQPDTRAILVYPENIFTRYTYIRDAESRALIPIAIVREDNPEIPPVLKEMLFRKEEPPKGSSDRELPRSFEPESSSDDERLPESDSGELEFEAGE